MHHPTQEVINVRITRLVIATATGPLGFGTRACVSYESQSVIGAPSVENSSRAKYHRGTITHKSVKPIRIRVRAMPYGTSEL